MAHVHVYIFSCVSSVFMYTRHSLERERVVADAVFL